MAIKNKFCVTSVNNFIKYGCISLILFLTSCYTIVENKSTVKRNALYQNHKIVGSWIHIERWIDYGDRIKKLDFYSNGEVLYYPGIERNGLEFYSGDYYINKDTLSIKLLNNSFEENFIFSIDNNKMIIEKIKSQNHINHSVVSTSKEEWDKEIF